MLASTRFNSKTFSEREEYTNKTKIMCYGAQIKIKSSIPLNALLFVVEMNNEKNQVMGIGLIRNIVSPDAHFIYEDNNYNRYIYTGKYRLTREQIEELDEDILIILEIILFKGYTHIKRHSGITIIPSKLLTDDRTRGVDLTNKVKEMFLNTFKK